MNSFKAFALSSVLVASAFVAPKALADGNCTNQYGATVECPPNRIVVNKTVKHPTSGVFFENLTSRDTAYAPGAEVEYDVAVTNTSNDNFPIVTVIDVFPGVVTFVAGPGRYETSGNKLTYEISNLGAGQTVHNRVVVKLNDKFTNDLTCEIVNTVTATGPGGQSDQDTASLCVATKVMGVTTLPVAGFEDYAYMIPFLALAVIGFGILAKGYIRP